MIISVVSNLVSFIDNSPDESRIFFRVYSNHKERGLRVGRFQNVQNLGRPLRIRTIIKRERDLMFATGALMVQRRKLGKRCVLRGEITVRVDGKLAHPVGATWI